MTPLRSASTDRSWEYPKTSRMQRTSFVRWSAEQSTIPARDLLSISPVRLAAALEGHEGLCLHRHEASER